MDSLKSGELPSRPEPGQVLVVIHDFIARSSDELSLSKGDRVELVERDDDFGDGWYLGKHLINGNSGLFPEVYTKPAPRGPPIIAPTSVSIPRSQPAIVPPPVIFNSNQYDSRKSVPVPEAEKTASATRHVSASQVLDATTVTSPLITSTTYENGNGNTMTIPTSSLSTSNVPRSLNLSSQPNLHIQGQDSPVMNETLSVIQEHISDMSTPGRSGILDRRGTNDSGSEYSSHIDRRSSYINGEETDEEEGVMHTEAEVSTWNPSHVADYLSSVGVESKHCDVFRDQEISGDVLLGMDQTSVFLKEFDLGSVGRRLKTWQKIKALQDEIKGIAPRRTTVTYGSDVGSEDSSKIRTRSSTATGTTLPRIAGLMERPSSRQTARYSQQQGGRVDSNSNMSPVSPIADSPSRHSQERRPSAASIRDLNHSRRHSSIDSGAMMLGKFSDGAPPGTLAVGGIPHKKQPSFDRNWTMGNTSPVSLSRPLSAAGSKGLLATEDELPGPNRTTLHELDRGYFSGGDADTKQRNVLRKRSGAGVHSRNSSYTDEQRIRTATTNTRHSRFGSADSIREHPHLSPASQKYYGTSASRRGTPSAGPIRPPPPPKDALSPTVTKLDDNDSPRSPKITNSPDSLSPAHSLAPLKVLGLRSISDAVTGNEKSRVASPIDNLASHKDESVTSPSHAGSSTTSGKPSFELESPSTSNSPIAMIGTPRNNRKKSKKETSAYTKGLEKKTPREQMIGCDYSGWMKKKNTNLMTTWKPRLFILKGRRLSYYYSENDEQEQGLIDISFHRVLPADNDRLTGLHATLTGATTSPTSPSNSHTPTMATADAAAEPQSSLSKSSGDQMFIFKLVPPRAGLSRAVNFTKPTVHYFAVPNIAQGRLWMAALMKATIDRDDSKLITSTYQQKTISLAKARAMRHRPPALMNLDENVEEDAMKSPGGDGTGLNIKGVIFDQNSMEGDSAVSGISKAEGGSFPAQISGKSTAAFGNSHSEDQLPQTN